MSATRRKPVRPVARWKVGGALILGIAALFLVVAGVDQLRHPPPHGGPITPELSGTAADPRFEIECPEEGASVPSDAVTSNELFDCPGFYDGRRVTYRGEAVGGVLRRDDGAWLQLNDDVYAQTGGRLPAHRDYQGGNAGVGVFVPLTLAEEIGVVGGPRARGDLVEVVGTYHRVDSVRNEASVIHAERGRVIRDGGPFSDPVLPDRAIAALFLGLLATSVAGAERVAARRRSR